MYLTYTSACMSDMRRWLRDDRLIVWIIAAGVLIGASLNGLLVQANKDEFSPVWFLTGFIGSFLLQVSILALLLKLGVRHPRLGGSLVLVIFVILALIAFPGYMAIRTEPFLRYGPLVGHPQLLAMYVITIIAYASSGILLLRMKPKTG